MRVVNRLFGLLAAAFAISLVGVSGALAYGRADDLPSRVSTPHFNVIFTDLNADRPIPSDSFAISHAEASSIGRYAEEAYEYYIRYLNMPAPALDPIDDADGRIDYYVVGDHFLDGIGRSAAPRYRFTSEGRPGGYSYVLLGDDAFTSDLDGDGVVTNDERQRLLGLVTRHELFHVFQAGMNTYEFSSPLVEGSAEWASGVVTDSKPLSRMYQTARPWISLDCETSESDLRGCGGGGDQLGYQRWPFFAFLADRIEPSIIANIFRLDSIINQADLRIGRTPRRRGFESTNAAIAFATQSGATSSNLSEKFAQFANFNLQNRYRGVMGSGWMMPPIESQTFYLPSHSGPLAQEHAIPLYSSAAATPQNIRLSVAPLAARYVEIQGYDLGDTVCHAQNLRLTVRMPASANAAPALALDGSVLPFTVSPDRTSATLSTNAWNSCKTGFVSLANAAYDPSVATSPNASFSIEGRVIEPVSPSSVELTTELAPGATTPLRSGAPEPSEDAPHEPGAQLESDIPTKVIEAPAGTPTPKLGSEKKTAENLGVTPKQLKKLKKALQLSKKKKVAKKACKKTKRKKKKSCASKTRR